MLKKFIANWIGLNLAWLLPGFHMDSWITVCIAAAVVTVLLIVVKPLLCIVTLPLTILTLGLFSFIIHMAIVYIAIFFIPGMSVESWVWALLCGAIIAIINWIINT